MFVLFAVLFYLSDTLVKVYDVKNETEEYYYIVDNTGRVGGFYKDYFQEQ